MLDKTEILDCTLRDGSYVNNFQFTKNDTKNFECIGEFRSKIY